MTSSPESPIDVSDGSLDQWVANAEAMAARYQQLATNVEQVAVTETTPDGLITVTVNSGGVLTDLRIADRATATMPASRIASAVLFAMHKAQSRISGQVAKVMKATLGDDDPTMEQAVLSRYAETFPAPPEPQQQRLAAVEEVRIGHDEAPQQHMPPAAAAPAAPVRRPAPVRRVAAARDEWDGGEASFLEEVDR